MDSLVIVDCQYDFIDGSLACSGSHEAVAYLINFINRHEMEVSVSYTHLTLPTNSRV